jgi:2-keto-4-pentenoate hydratase/2-oxohepta-3-ene-1,7-dioic acid hydratase in catechol pathway
LKLLTFLLGSSVRLGVVLENAFVADLGLAYQTFLESHEGESSEPLSDFPADVSSLIQSDAQVWQAALDTEARLKSTDQDASTSSFIHPASQIRVIAPLSRPSKIVCVGLNYRDHCREHGFDIPQSPILFAKFPSAIIGPGDGIEWPEGVSSQVDYEAELAVVIGKQGRHIAADQALDYVAGYTILNDISARDVQFADGQWIRGKSFDTFCPVGPYLVTPDEVEDPQQLAIRCWVNDQLVQDSTTSEMIFSVAELLAFISRTSTLLPGDIIATGTPSGVGSARTPPVLLKRGDVVKVAIENLGCLENPVVGGSTSF